MSWTRCLWLCLIASHASAQAGPFELDAGALDDADASSGDEGDEVSPASELRGLLASAPFDKQPLKGLYFFPGESATSNQGLYTAHPSLAADTQWNSAPSTRSDVIERMIAAHVNTVLMSYWGDEMPQWSPMELDATSVAGVLDAVSGKPILVIPSLESGYDSSAPDGPHWSFCEDFPYTASASDADPEALAPSFLARLHELVDLFQDHRSAWAQMYDRNGTPRYVVHVLQVYALHVPRVAGKTADQVFVEAFDAVAARIKRSDGIDIGFTLDVVGGNPGTYELTPSNAGLALERAVSVLSLQLYVSEARYGSVIKNAPWDPPFDNNASNLGVLIDNKLRTLSLWRIAGVPVVYDVTPGFDGRFVWAQFGTGFWGDNFAYTSDDWRNLESESRSAKFTGISFNTWNGYTEGYAATPTVEHGTTIYDWLTDLYKDDPRECHHAEYQDGRVAYRLDGPICEKWRNLDGRRGVLGEPTSDVQTTERASFAHFLEGSVFASASSGVHEVHGLIHDEYQRLGYDASCLGLPLSDQYAAEGDVQSRFEHGTISLAAGANQARSHCDEPD